jgi:Mg2+ and Co2+ transporter CorA
MDDKELRNLLEQLHTEIERTENVDEKGRQLLRDLGTDINELLARTEDDLAQPHPTITQRLEDSIDHLEVANPDLTQTLAKLLSILSNAGI